MEPPVRAVWGVERGLVSLALVWQALWLVADPRLWPTAQASVGTALAIVVSMLAWLALLVAHVRRNRRMGTWARWVDLSGLVAASAGMLAAAGVAAEPDWGVPASWSVLCAGVAGLLFAGRIAVCWVATVVILQAAFIFGFFGVGEPVAGASDLLYAGYALSVGITAVAARYVLLREAARADTARDLMAAAARERVAAERDSDAVRRDERVLHETVLNTLTAITRGRMAPTPEMTRTLRARSLESARVLRTLQAHLEPLATAPTAGRLDLDVRAHLDALSASGTVVHVECDPLPVPGPVYTAIVTATREALSNAARHADAQALWLATRVTVSSGATSVVVEVRDDGQGFSTTRSADRFGLREAIANPMAIVGGHADVTSEPGSGTRVLMSWPSASAAAAETGATGATGQSTAAFTIPVLLSFGAYTTAQVVIGWGEFAAPVLNGLAFAIFAALVVVLGAASLRGSFGWPVLLLVAGVSPLVYQLQTQALGDAVADSWVAWSSSAVVALFVVLAAGGPPWGWGVVLVSWLLIQGDVIEELMAPGTAIILAASLFGHSRRRNAVLVESSRLSEAALRSAEHEARDEVGRMLTRYGALHQTRAADLLEAIADGRLDPQDPTVRADAALEEGFIRNVLRVDPSVDAVHALASSLAVEARHAGVFLDIDIAGTIRIDDLAEVSRSLTRALECSQPGGTARFTARREGTEDVVRLVAPIWPTGREAMARLPVRGVILDPTDPSDPDMLWEIRSDSVEGSRPAASPIATR